MIYLGIECSCFLQYPRVRVYLSPKHRNAKPYPSVGTSDVWIDSRDYILANLGGATGLLSDTSGSAKGYSPNLRGWASYQPPDPGGGAPSFILNPVGRAHGQSPDPSGRTLNLSPSFSNGAAFFWEL